MFGPGGFHHGGPGGFHHGGPGGFHHGGPGGPGGFHHGGPGGFHHGRPFGYRPPRHRRDMSGCLFKLIAILAISGLLFSIIFSIICKIF